MAVFTEITADCLANWLNANTNLSLTGEPEGISEGIENTNYCFDTTSGSRYLFTVIEVWKMDIALYCASFSRHLYDNNLPVPATIRLSNDSLCGQFEGKPAVVVQFVDGKSKRQPSAENCATIGSTLARLHNAARMFDMVVANSRGASWRQTTANKLAKSLNSEDSELLNLALKADQACQAADLPNAACHCDLFRNNVLWQENELVAIIDFYFAGHDQLIFDLAVTAVDWSLDDNGVLDQAKLSNLLSAYNSARALTDLEQELLPLAFQVACLRFWLSRMNDKLNPRPSKILVEHNPAAFKARLISCIENSELIKRSIG